MPAVVALQCRASSTDAASMIFQDPPQAKDCRQQATAPCSRSCHRITSLTEVDQPMHYGNAATLVSALVMCAAKIGSHRRGAASYRLIHPVARLRLLHIVT